MTQGRLPPLAALRAFEAAARRLSFKQAAAELFVTPTAISHQVRQLEDFLGMRVLDRSPRSVSLTPAGKELYEATAAGFAQIARALSRLHRGPGYAALTLSATPAFLGQWLIPRLGELRRLLPGIDLRLHASNTALALEASDAEIAIRYGKGPFPGLDATALASDRFAPVCSPALRLGRIADLRNVSLIHIDGMRVPRPQPTWARWCAQARVNLDVEVGLRFSDSLHALQAAVAGQGVVLASLVLAADALKSGLLVQPFGESLPGATYHFICSRESSARTDVLALRDWLLRSLNP
ncbi:MAG TPA: LysR substrate-binding domain-containing protein [Steroidobacteraceae bacterium]|nr:LysR substrate-binding domain-containing protein [Steroidobacteraceae bacterium]